MDKLLTLIVFGFATSVIFYFLSYKKFILLSLYSIVGAIFGGLTSELILFVINVRTPAILISIAFSLTGCFTANWLNNTLLMKKNIAKAKRENKTVNKSFKIFTLWQEQFFSLKYFVRKGFLRNQIFKI